MKNFPSRFGNSDLLHGMQRANFQPLGVNNIGAGPAFLQAEGHNIGQRLPAGPAAGMDKHSALLLLLPLQAALAGFPLNCSKVQALVEPSGQCLVRNENHGALGVLGLLRRRKPNRSLNSS